MAIKLQLSGFDTMMQKIQEAGGSINSASEKCIKESASIMRDELVSEMKASDVESRLVLTMPSNAIEVEGNQYKASVGYKKGAYNPNDISDGYKVVFLNYGTPNRSKHGKIVAKGFIQRAKATAKPKIRKQQQKTLKEILRSLE